MPDLTDRLKELLARVEGASGPDREISRDLHWLFIGPMTDGWPPPYTYSIDAALALVERVLPGWGFKCEAGLGYGISVTIGHVGPNKLYDRPEGWGEGSTLPLAILAALLNAKISQEQEAQPVEGK